MRASVNEYVPQFVSEEEAVRRWRRAFFAWCAVAGVGVALLGAVVLAPVMLANGWAGAAQAVYLGFHAVCHQIPERSFHVRGFPLAVCARCAGLYAGGAAAVLLYPLVRGLLRTDAPARGWLFAAALPTAIDFALGVTGLWENTHASRFLTALLLGGAVAFYVVPAIVGVGLTPARQFFQPGTYAKG